MKCDYCKDDGQEFGYRKYTCLYCNDTGIKREIVLKRFIHPARDRILAKIEEYKNNRNRRLA